MKHRLIHGFIAACLMTSAISLSARADRVWASAVVVNGKTASVTVTPPVTASTYTTGAVIGGLITLPGLARISSGLIQSVSISIPSGATGSFDVVFFNAAPSGGTITDGTQIAISAADAPKVAGIVHVTDCSLLAETTMNFCQATTLALPFALPSGTSGYAVIVARSAVTLGSTSDVALKVTALQD